MNNRYIANLFCTRWSLRRRFGGKILDAIEEAIRESETLHSGELRFAIEAAIDVPSLMRGATARDRAIATFAQLHTWDTQANNGILIYLLVSEQDIEIVADRGYDGKVAPAEWQGVCDLMKQHFSNGQFESGAVLGIQAVTELIVRHYPLDPDDHNELPNRPTLL